MKIKNREGFTFIELLVVIAIIAILSIGVIFFLNPAQLQKQGRDSNRLSNVTVLNQNVALYHEVNPSGSLGSSTILYVSIPDPAATSTAGTDCSGMGFPTGSTYHCAASSTYRKTDGTGWVPINFAAVPSISLETLPIDPTNSTSSNEYYIYVTNGSQYEILANPEAAKTIASSASSSYTQGNDVALLPTFPGNTGGPITFSTSTAPLAVTSPNEGIAFDSTNNSIWESNYRAGSVMQINDTTYATSTYPVYGYPEPMVFDPHTNSIWIANDDNTVTQINVTTHATSTYVTSSNVNTGIAFDSNTNTIWLTETSTVTEIDDTTHVMRTHPALGAYEIAFDPHNNSIWVTSGNNINPVMQINDTTYVTSTYSIPYAYSIAYDSNTKSMWMTTGYNTAVAIDDTTYVTSTVNIGSRPFFLAFDPHSNSIWVPDGGDTTMTQINDITFATSTYSLGFYATAITFDPHNNSIWVLGNGSLVELIPNH